MNPWPFPAARPSGAPGAPAQPLLPSSSGLALTHSGSWPSCRAAATVFEVPDAGDVPRPDPGPRDQRLGLALERVPPPAPAAAGTLLLGERHGAVVRPALLSRETDGPIQLEQA